MGTATSHHHLEPPMMDQPLYPDMNVIFKGIPKMMQVADDMHLLTQSIIDLRNLTFAMAIISLIGMICFLLLKYMQGRRGVVRRRRRLHNQTDSEQSSLNRPYRQYSQKPLEWSHHSHKVDMEKLLEHSTSSHGSQHTPPAIPTKRTPVPDYHSVERTPPPITSNGAVLKRLDPVKLLIDEVPYADT